MALSPKRGGPERPPSRCSLRTCLADATRPLRPCRECRDLSGDRRRTVRQAPEAELPRAVAAREHALRPGRAVSGDRTPLGVARGVPDADTAPLEVREARTHAARCTPADVVTGRAWSTCCAAVSGRLLRACLAANGPRLRRGEEHRHRPRCRRSDAHPLQHLAARELLGLELCDRHTAPFLRS